MDQLPGPAPLTGEIPKPDQEDVGLLGNTAGASQGGSTPRRSSRRVHWNIFYWTAVCVMSPVLFVAVLWETFVLDPLEDRRRRTTP